LSLFPKLSPQSIPGIFSVTATFVAHPADELVVAAGVAGSTAADATCNMERIPHEQIRIPPTIRKIFFFIKCEIL
jgi:hypothetical protein